MVNNMDLNAEIDDWKKYPNSLGSEAQVAVLIGSIAAKTGEVIPENIKSALKALSLRGTMRDIASAIQRGREHRHNPDIPSFNDVVILSAASCEISWGEALAEIAQYLDEQKVKLG